MRHFRPFRTIAWALFAFMSLMATQLGGAAAQPDTVTTEAPDTVVAAAVQSPAARVVPTSPVQAMMLPGFTGDATVDFGADSVIIVDPSGVDVGMPNAFPADRVSGNDLEDVRFRYDAATDTLFVAFNSFGIAGDADGDGDPGATGSILAGLGGSDQPDFSNGETFALLIDADEDGEFDVIAGVPAGSGLGDFAVAQLSSPLFASAPSLSLAYGTPLPANNGGVHVSPTAAAPDLTLAISSFSTLVGGDTSLNFSMNAFIGSIDDAGIGEDFVPAQASGAPVVLDARIGDTVWSDDNRNGIQDAGELGLPMITVNLLDQAGNVVQSTTTDGNGTYEFIVAPGSHVVEFVLDGTTAFSPQGEGGDPTVDSDADPTSGRTAPVTVSAGEARLDIDAGIIALSAGVQIEKATNGVDSDTAPGETLQTGSTATFTYDVTNTGDLDLIDLVVTDNQLGQICVIDLLVVGTSAQCTSSKTVTPGLHANLATVTATPTSGGTSLPVISDDDPSHHRGSVDASIDIEKATNGEDADTGTGPVLDVGTTATFTYVVTNTGNVPLTNVRVTDDLEGDICTIDNLAVGAVDQCTATRVVTEGQYANVGQAVGTPVIPGETSPDIAATDPSHHLGQQPGPLCTPNLSGPRLWTWGDRVWDSGHTAEAGSEILIVTTEPGDSPDQPNEQVWVKVGEDLYGPTPIGLGELQFTVLNTGPVSVHHYSDITGDTEGLNSVEFALCGNGLS